MKICRSEIRWALVCLSIVTKLYAQDDINALADALRYVIKAHYESGVETPIKRPELELITEDLDKDLAELEAGNPQEILPTQMKVPRNAKLTMRFPLLGTVVFLPIFDKGNNLRGFQALMPQTDQPFVWGPLTIERGLFKIVDGKLSYNARVTFFDKKAVIGLKEFSLTIRTISGGATQQKDKEELEKQKAEVAQAVEKNTTVEVYRLVLGLTFENESFALELAPGKSIELKTIDLIFEQGKGIHFTHAGQVFGQQFTFSALIDTQKKEFSLEGELAATPLSNIISDVEESVIKDLMVEGKLFYNFSQGLFVQGDLTNVGNEPVTLAGITLNEAHIDIITQKKHALISGKTNILGLPLEGYFALFFGDKTGLKFAIDIPSQVKNWKPFEQSGIPGLQDIIIHSLKGGLRTQYLAAEKGEKIPENKVLGKEIKKSAQSETLPEVEQKFKALVARADDVVLEGDKGASISFFVAGKSTILNISSEVIIKVEKTPTTAFSGTLFAELPLGWKLSNSFEFLRPTGSQDPLDVARDAVDLFALNKARFIVSTHKTEIEGYKIDAGLNIMADVTIDGSTDNTIIQALATTGIIKQGEQGASLHFQGVVDPTDPKNASFKIGLSAGGFGFNVGPMRFEGGAFDCVIRGTPSIAFAGNFTMIPQPGDTPLQFYFDFFFTPLDFGVSASMKNTWKNPFNIKGFEFGNLGGKASQTWSVFAEAAGTAGIAALIPATFGLTGEVKFGEGNCYTTHQKGDAVCGKVTFNIGKNVTDLALIVDVSNPITLVTLLEVLLKQMDADASLLRAVDTLAPVRVRHAKLYFVPMGTTIGDIKVRAGIGAALYVDVLGREFHADGSIGLDGVVLKGKIPAFELGPILMTNFEQTCDVQTGKYKQDTDKADEACGPTVDIQANTTNVHFIIDGLMKLGGMFQSKTQWQLSSQGIKFETQTFFGPDAHKFGVHVKGTSIPFNDYQKLIDLEPEDITLEMQFQDDLSEKIREDVIEELKKDRENFERHINGAIEQLVRDATEKDIEAQQEKVQEAADRRVSFFDNPGLSLKREFEYRAEILRLEGLRIKLAFENSVMGVVLKSTVRNLGLDTLAQQMLLGIKYVGIGINDQVQFFFKNVAALPIVKKVYWKGSLVDVGRGVLPGIDVVMCAGCRQFTYKTPPFNVLNPIQGVHDISSTLAQAVVDAVVATFEGATCEKPCGIRGDKDEDVYVGAPQRNRGIAIETAAFDEHGKPLLYKPYKGLSEVEALETPQETRKAQLSESIIESKPRSGIGEIDFEQKSSSKKEGIGAGETIEPARSPSLIDLET